MLRPSETALIIVDMQNAYASPGGYLDLAGFDISGAAPAIDKIGEAAAAARAAGMPVIFFQNGWDPDYVEAGGPGSPNWHKSNALKTMRKQAGAAGQAAGQGRLGLRAGRRRCRRSPATSSSPSRATAPSSTPTSTACCARAASARWSSPASPPMSASSRPCATASSWNISAWCCTTPRTRRGPTSSSRPSLYNIEKFFGWVSSVEEFRTRPAGQHQSDADNEGRDLMPMKAIFPAGHRQDAGALFARHHGRRHRLCLGHAGARQGDQRRPCRRRRGADRVCAEQIKSVIETAGGTMADVTFNPIFITDWANYAADQQRLCQVSSRATSRRATASSAAW